LTQLFAKTLDLIHGMMQNFDEDFTKSDALLFEKALLTLCLFCIGGQRREFVVNMTLQVIYF
jgi:hypothetical protein